MERHGEGFETSPVPNQSDRARIIMAVQEIRPIRVEGNVAYVTLTQGYVAVIDAADVPLVEGRNWCAKVKARSVYAKRIDWSSGKPRTIYLHRFLMEAPDAMEVDHRDGNGLNNSRINLRVATPHQNTLNRRLSRRNTSGFKGVRWVEHCQRWRATIGLNGKQYHLGVFPTPEEAYAAYCEANANLHRDFGRTE
jgi:hypothetical protein